jgi:hypothetical protein
VIQTPDLFEARGENDAPRPDIAPLSVRDNHWGVREEAFRRTNTLKDSIKDAILVQLDTANCVDDFQANNPGNDGTAGESNDVVEKFEAVEKK